MQVIPVNLQDRSYEIEIAPGALDRIGVALASLGNVSRVVLISDENVDKLCGERVATSIVDRGLDLDVVVIEPGEESKSIEVAYSLWEQLLDVGADRKSVVAALGGGVVGDLSGFVAATYARGVRYFQIPTTLLAQVDSSVGGKTAIDLPKGKNMVGAFHQPCGVLVDTEVLQSLPDREYVSGLGEVVKYGVSLDRDFFVALEENVDAVKARDPEALEKVVACCCAIKAKIVEEDEKETSGRRALLNYGHTFGHSIEAALGYGAIPHGHAVLVGSILAARLANRLRQSGDERFNAIDDAWIERQLSLYRQLELPTSLQDLGRDYGDSPETTPERLLELMSGDKKTEFGKLNFILPVNLGECVYAKAVPAADVLAVLG
ncbi:MAG: 3-dehydroquinate synthase [Thermoguttaceae bacterium]|nr:3-dehydroquinate synthase [Thermoguttaceae bacterium]